MKQPDLRSLSRGELLEILIQQGEELEKLRRENEAYQMQLRDKTLNLREAGSIAEAALKVSGVFDAAQQASDQYLQNIQVLRHRRGGDIKMLRNGSGGKAGLPEHIEDFPPGGVGQSPERALYAHEGCLLCIQLTIWLIVL